jgi:hypothetical protein
VAYSRKKKFQTLLRAKVKTSVVAASCGHSTDVWLGKEGVGLWWQLEGWQGGCPGDITLLVDMCGGYRDK